MLWIEKQLSYRRNMPMSWALGVLEERMRRTNRTLALTLAGGILCVGFALGGEGQDGSHDTMFADFLASYDEAFNAKDLDTLAMFYDPEVTIFEGGGVNRGWADYRDHHLGPELEAFEDLKFGHSDVRAFPLSAESAYVTAEYHLETRYQERDVDVTGLATLLLVKKDGHWKIRHSHTSSRRTPARQ